MQGDCSHGQHQAYRETGRRARKEGPSIDSKVSCQQASIQQRPALPLHAKESIKQCLVGTCQ